MDTRQQQLLTLVIENYIATAEPIGSRFLVEKAGLNWSEATVRNELRELEEQGYLTHPHTSAGRIPTPKGYNHYIQSLKLENLKLAKNEGTVLEKAFEAMSDYEQARKNMAKALVELSRETIIVAFSPDFVYYTGLSNLFGKPDWADQGLVADVSEMFDRCEDFIPEFFNEVVEEPKFFLGDDHPFGDRLSVVSMRFGESGESLIALIGPQRMDYKHNWELMRKVSELI